MNKDDNILRECIDTIFKQLREEENSSFSLLIPDLNLTSVKDNHLLFNVSRSFTKTRAEKGFTLHLKKAIFDEIGVKVEIEIKVNSKKESKDEIKEKKEIKPIKQHSVNKGLIGFKEKYTFNNFVVADSNAFAVNLARSVAIEPGKNSNPLLIYGGVGLGKTHLIQAIGNEILKNQKTRNLNPFYTSAEAFTNDFIEMISQNKGKQFRNKYRNVDVLLIDDIHFLQKKAGTQEELFHTFNELFENDKQLVFTCDRPIEELENITDRLKSRFSRGVNVDLAPYNYEARLAILTKKEEMIEDVKISMPILDLIAKQVQTNIRDVESMLFSVASYARFLNQDTLDFEQAQSFLISNLSKYNVETIPLEKMIKEVSDYFNISSTDIISKSKGHNIPYARNCFVYIAKKSGSFTYTEIGAFLKRAHSTISYMYNNFEPTLAYNQDSKLDITKIKNKLNLTF